MIGLNERLRQMRKHLNKSQSEFGAAGGVSQSTQNRYEQPGTDVPVSYLSNILDEYGSVVREAWLYHGKGEMLKKGGERHALGEVFSDLSPKESQILDEVEQFSEFLKTRPLRPRVKRQLLQLLIESIDQALEQLDDEDPGDSSTQ